MLGKTTLVANLRTGFFFFFIFVRKKTGKLSLTCSVDFLQAQSPHLGCRFVALIPPSFTSLNPFEKFFRPLQPQPICMRIPGSTSRFRLYIENAVTRNNPCIGNQFASQ